MKTPIVSTSQCDPPLGASATKTTTWSELNPRLLTALRGGSISGSSVHCQPITAPRSVPLTDLEAPSLLNVLIAYEDFATGRRAMRLCDNLIAQLGKDLRFQTNSWKFEFLRVPNLKHMATQDALEADVIIISAHGGADLPAEVRSWMEGWPPQPAEVARALVALLDHGEEPTELYCQVRAYLQGFAQRSQFDFFSHSYPNSGSDAEYLSCQVAANAETDSWGIPGARATQPTGRPQSGINE